MTSDRDRQLVRRHCDWLACRNDSPSTIKHRRQTLLRVSRLLPCNLLDVTRDDLELWQHGQRRRLSPAALGTYTGHVQGLYRWCVDVELLTVNPALRLARVRLDPNTARPIPDADLDVALAAADEPMLTWLVLGAFMGLRAMEIAQIRREDVVEVDGRLKLVGIGKWRRPFRLSIPPEVAALLTPHMQRHTGQLWPVTPYNVTVLVGRFFRSLEMPWTCHNLRHTFGTWFYRQTRDLLLTQDVMRHASPTSTRIYVQTTDAQAMAAMDQLSQRLHVDELETRRRRRGRGNAKGAAA